MVLNKEHLFSTALPGSGVNIFSSNVTLSQSQSGYMRTYFCADCAGVLTGIITEGSTYVTESYGPAANLTAGKAYMFDIPLTRSQSLNLRYSGSSTGNINRLFLDEYGG